MVLDVFRAILFAGLPIALASYYLVRLTSKTTQLESTNATQLKKELKTIAFADNKEGGFVQKMLHKKFLKFGGGFYGIMTLLTYLHIELYQIIEFINNFDGFSGFIQSIGFSMVLNFFLEAIMNMVAAFLWPFYWFKFMPIGSFWVWLIVAVLAHTFATRYALSKRLQ